MLTATPINNRLSDFRHMAELFTRRDETYFARTLGVNNLRAHFNNMEKALRQNVGHDIPDVAEVIGEAQDILAADPIFSQPRRPAQPSLCTREPDARDRQGGGLP